VPVDGPFLPRDLIPRLVGARIKADAVLAQVAVGECLSDRANRTGFSAATSQFILSAGPSACAPVNKLL
jgi:hypothetical protein